MVVENVRQCDKIKITVLNDFSHVLNQLSTTEWPVNENMRRTLDLG